MNIRYTREKVSLSCWKRFPGVWPLALLAILCTSTPSYGMTVLKGIILKNELGGRPIANVPVSAAHAAPVVSNSYGRFTLEFMGPEPGARVDLAVDLGGHVVVNYTALGLNLPRDPDAHPVTLLLCREDVREEMARRFYRLKSIEAIEASFDARLVELSNKGADDSDARRKLVEERDRALSQVDDLAADLARVKPEETSGLYQEAMRHFLAGELDAAITFLDDAKLKKGMEQARVLKAQGERALDQAVDAYVLKARLLTTQLRFDEAERTYQTLIHETPDSFQAHFSYAHFCQLLNRYHPARMEYEHALVLARRYAKRRDVAMILNNLGNVLNSQNRMEEARKAYEEALETYSELAKDDPETYTPDVAMTLNNLGGLHQKQNRMEEARKAYEEALETYRELAKDNPETYRLDVAMTLNNLGVLHCNQNRMEEARKAYEEALETYRELAKDNPETYRHDVAKSLKNLGSLHCDQDRMEDARKAYEETLETYRELAKDNPETYRLDVAMTLNNLGVLHCNQNRMEDAGKAYEEALQTYRELAKDNPETYRPYVATILNNLGVLYSDENRVDDACKAYEEALETYRELAKDNPETYRPDVAMTLKNLGGLHFSQDRMEDAQKAFEMALYIYRDMASLNPDRYSGDVAQVEEVLELISR